jgi:hypothetical protein
MKEIINPFLLLLFLLSSSPALSQNIDSLIAIQQIDTLIYSGPKDNRINWAIQNKGTGNPNDEFSSADQLRQALEDDLLLTFTPGGPNAQNPFAQYRNFFNLYSFYWPDAPSNDEGWNFIILKAIRDSIFLPWADDTHGWATLFATTRFGEGGGAGLDVNKRVGDGSMFGTGYETFLHEFCHTMPGIGDEYTASGGTCNEGPNGTPNTEWENVPWRRWIDEDTPIPTPYTDTYLEEIGAFEGAYYSFFGCFRPSARACFMGAGGFGDGYGLDLCEPCIQRVICQLYKYVNVIENPLPAATQLSVTGAETITFSADIISPIPNTQSWHWILNGKVIASGVDEVTVTFGDCDSYELILAVNDTTPMVRYDEKFAHLYPRPYQERKWIIEQTDVDNYSITAEVIASPADCLGENSGIAEFIVEGGQAPYEFISNGALFSNPAPELLAGDYSFSIVDANGCSIEKEVSIGQDPILDPMICSELQNDDWRLQVSDDHYGESELTYLWSTGATESGIFIQEDGTYSVTVSTSTGCSVVKTAFVTLEDEALEVSHQVFPSDENRATGRVYLNAEQGTPPYRIRWRKKINHVLTNSEEQVLASGGDFGNQDFKIFCVEDLGNSGGSCAENELTLTIKIDDFGDETWWELKDEFGETIYNGGPYAANSEQIVDFCLPDGCYEFRIFDDFGDGICCQYGYGGYQILNPNLALAIASGSTNGTLPIHAFDQTLISKWQDDQAQGAYIGYQLPQTGRVLMYAITSAQDEPGGDPRNWQLQGSDDQQSWTSVDERIDEVFDDRLQRRIFTISNNASSFLYYRLFIQDNHGAPFTHLQELELVGVYEKEPFEEDRFVEDQLTLTEIAPGFYEYLVKDASLLTVLDTLYIDYTQAYDVGQISVIQESDCSVAVENPDADYLYYWFPDEAGTTILGTGVSFQPPNAGNFFIRTVDNATQAMSDNAYGFSVNVPEKPTLDVSNPDSIYVIDPDPELNYFWFDEDDCGNPVHEGSAYAPVQNGTYYVAAQSGIVHPDPVNPYDIPGLLLHMDATDLNGDTLVDFPPLPSSSGYDWQFTNGNQWEPTNWFSLRANYQNGLPVADFATMWLQRIEDPEGPWQTMIMAYEENPISWPESAPFEAMEEHFPKNEDNSQIYSNSASDLTANGKTFLNGQQIDPFETSADYGTFTVLGTVLESPTFNNIFYTDTHWEGKIGELLFYESELNDEEMIGLSEYLRRKWISSMDLQSKRTPIDWNVVALETPEEIKRLRIFPNPGHDKVEVSGLEGKCQIRISNVQGQILKNVKVKLTGTFTLDLDSLPSGTYIISVEEKQSGMQWVQKWVKM